MSHERKMLEDLKMPKRREVEQAILRSLFSNNGAIKEFAAGEKIVDDIANDFGLNEKQRTAYLETVYRKENRIKKSYLWHRLLFRAADSLAKGGLVSRPTQTVILTNNKEWMLTEEGYSRILEIMQIPFTQKEILPIRSYEVQKIVKKIFQQQMPDNYNPQETKNIPKTSIEVKLRARAFKQAIKEAYDYKCAVCGMKLCSPNFKQWEVEAAHIVPRGANGKDDLVNGLALCRLHHWTFDAGWFTLEENFRILASRKIKDLPADFGRFGSFDFMKQLAKEDQKISLPKNERTYPHPNSIKWHRENIYYS